MVMRVIFKFWGDYLILKKSIIKLNLEAARTSAATSTFELPSFALDVGFLFFRFAHGLASEMRINAIKTSYKINKIDIPFLCVAQTRNA